MKAKLPKFTACSVLACCLALALLAIPVAAVGQPNAPRNAPKPPAAGYPRDARPPAISSYPRDLPGTPRPNRPAAGQGRGVAPAAPARVENAVELIAAAQRTINSHASITAKLREEIELFDERVVGTGNYLQVTDGRRLWRLDMILQGETGTSLSQQICDGSQLWIHLRQGDTQQLRTVDLARVSQTLQSAPEAAGRPFWGTGGISHLLQSLSDAFIFARPESTTWQGKPVYRMTGRWRPAVLAELAPDQKERILAGQGVDLRKLGPHLPDAVALYIGIDDLFPRRIEYVRHSVKRWYQRSATPSPPKTIAAIEFFDVKVGLPVDEQRFRFPSGNLAPNDYTDQYLAKLKWGVPPLQ